LVIYPTSTNICTKMIHSRYTQKMEHIDTLW
jgi:hypothetical protein